ncbi:MAG: DUF4091 domain-containing protein [Phycisphaerales bacterium]|nr:DUF4091 domain-containing protein [Phycisphaerales bacterium]
MANCTHGFCALIIALLGLPIFGQVRIDPNGDCTLREEINYNADGEFGLAVKHHGTVVYMEFTLGTAPASQAKLVLHQRDRINKPWPIMVRGQEFRFDETKFTAWETGLNWPVVGTFVVDRTQHTPPWQVAYELDLTDWYNANLGKTMTLLLVRAQEVEDIWGPHFEDREGTKTGNAAMYGPRIEVVPVDADAVQLWPSSPLAKVLRSDTPGESVPPTLAMEGARGEVVSGQAVARYEPGLAGATAQITELKHRNQDAIIPAESIRLQWVRYIDITNNSHGIPRDELVAEAPTAIPDPYWEERTIPVPAGQAQPLWIEVHVPYGIPAGEYETSLTVSGGPAPVTLPVTLHVWDFDLPRDRPLSVTNWWNFPGRFLRDQVQEFSDEYWALLARSCRFLVEHRQTDIFGWMGMIEESGDEETGYTHDISKFERYAEIAFEAGIKRIQMHSLAASEKKPGDNHRSLIPFPQNFRRLAVLADMARRRGWTDRFLLSIIDEPTVEFETSYNDVARKAREIAPGMRIIEACETEHYDMDIFVPKLSAIHVRYPAFDELRRQGAELWFYTCCHPVGRYPNRFLDQTLLHVRVMHWINYLYQLDGYLHWGLNQYWGDDPYTEEGISHGYPLGDRAVAYPGKQGFLGSIRFSAHRDGIQDFEYLYVLEERLREIKERFGAAAYWLNPRDRPLELCRRVVWSFYDYTRDPNKMIETRRVIAEEIEALTQEPFIFVQTSPSEEVFFPAGPRFVYVRGLVSPGSTVKINDKPVEDVRANGFFQHPLFGNVTEDRPGINVTVEKDGATRTVRRVLKLSE